MKAGCALPVKSNRSSIAGIQNGASCARPIFDSIYIDVKKKIYIGGREKLIEFKELKLFVGDARAAETLHYAQGDMFSISLSLDTLSI